MWGQVKRSMRRASRCAAILVTGLVLTATATATAGPETRTLRLYHINLHETSEITFKRDGKYLPEGLKKANWALRDWRRNQATKMDPRLLDLLWEAYQQSGSRQPIHVIGGFRAPETNKMLRSRSAFSGVAEHSQHVLGKAVDFFIPDVPLAKMRAIGLKMQIGGVGYYPRSGAPFVHFDVGKGRYWPRMSRRDLVQIFPKGNTIHVPADGKPLPGYETAMASYNKRKGASELMVADAGTRAAKPGRSLLARLFGGGADEAEDNEDAAPASRPAARPVRPAAPEPEIAVASAEAPRVAVPSRVPARPSVAPMPDMNAFDASAPGVPPTPATGEIEVAALLPRRVPLPTAAPGRPVPEAMEPSLVAALEDTDGAPGELAYAVPQDRPSFDAAFGSGAERAIAAETSADDGALTPESIIAGAMRDEARTAAAARTVVPTSAPASVMALAPDGERRGHRNEAGSRIVAALEAGPGRLPPMAVPGRGESAAPPIGSVAVPSPRGGRVGGAGRSATRAPAAAVARPAPPRDEIAMLIADTERRALEADPAKPVPASLIADRPSEVLVDGFSREAASPDPRRFEGKAVGFLRVRKLD